MRSEISLPNTVPEGYEEHYRLTHREMIPFVQVRLRQFHNPLVLLFWLLNLALLGSIAFIIVYHPVPFAVAIGRVSLGIAAFFLLIPLHEAVHGLAYKLCGAKKVSFHAEPRKLMFYALADRFVAGYNCFMGVAFAPFLLITAGLLFLQFTIPADWSWFCWGMLFMHTSGCAGDFALAAYFYENRHHSPLTYDLKNEGITVFLRKKVS